MIKPNPKDIKKIKECVDWLNESHSTSDSNMFLAFWEYSEGVWKVLCNNYFTYFDDDEFTLSIQSIRELYPELSIVFFNQHMMWFDNTIKTKKWNDSKILLIK